MPGLAGSRTESQGRPRGRRGAGAGGSAGSTGQLDLEKAVHHAEQCRDRYQWLLAEASAQLSEAKAQLYEADRHGTAPRELPAVRDRLPGSRRWLLEAAQLQPQVERLPELRAALWARRAAAAGQGEEVLQDAQSLTLALAQVLRPLVPSLRVIDPRLRSPAEAAALEVLERLRVPDAEPTLHTQRTVDSQTSHATTSQITEEAISEGVVPVEDEAVSFGYITDVKGHWPHFCKYVDISQCLTWEKSGDHIGDSDVKDSRLVLRSKWHFVYGGNVVGDAPWSMHLANVLVDLKKRHPEEVHLILGDRDIQQIRLTSELTEAELARLEALPKPCWLTEAQKQAAPTALEFVRTAAAEQARVKPGSVTEAMIEKHNTKVNRLRWLLAHTTDTPRDFDLRRQCIAKLRTTQPAKVKEEDVCAVFEKSVEEDGPMREYLRLGQLAALLGSTLIVHSGLCSSSGAWALGAVPGASEAETAARALDLRSWVDALNAWASSEISAWISRPHWEKPPSDDSTEAWARRGGAGLLQYGLRPQGPSVVFDRWLEDDGTPRPYPADLARKLVNRGVRRVLTGHTPHGSCPTVVHHDCGLQVVMADSSRSQPNSNLSFFGDQRGALASAIVGERRTLKVLGRMPEGTIHQDLGGRDAERLGRVLGQAAGPLRGYFVKAWLIQPNKRRVWLLNKMEGGKFDSKVVSDEELQAASAEAPETEDEAEAEGADGSRSEGSGGSEGLGGAEGAAPGSEGAAG